MTDNACARCGQPFPGDHEQDSDTDVGQYERVTLVYWMCPIIEE